METTVALSALLLAAVSLGLGVRLVTGLNRVRTVAHSGADEAAHAQASAEAATRQVAELEREITSLRQELVELRTVIERPVLAPLPSAGARNLDDLREHLRAAHATVGEDDDG